MSRGPYTTTSGATLQSALAPKAMLPGRAMGKMLRGVVVATYVTDDPKNPYNRAQANAYAVYCDVLCYGPLAGGTPTLMPNALVSQERAGIQSGDIWHPKAATMDVSGAPLSLTQSNLMNLDGDHVLIGFVDDMMSQPVILRALPHPMSDIGQAAAEPQDGQGVRMKLVDGNPAYRKHNGSVLGVSPQGDVLLRTLYANTGELTAQGAPPGPPKTGDVGNVLLELHSRAQRLTRLIDMDNPASPQDVLQEVVSLALYQIEFMRASAHFTVKDAGGNTLDAKGSGAQATLQVGSGTVSVAIAENLQQMYTQLKLAFDTHLHGTALGPSNTASGSGFTAPPWQANIRSDKVTIPDTV